MTPPTQEIEQPAKLSKVEGWKAESDGLAGTIKPTLESAATHLDDADGALIKHHGSYQQDNRDERAALKKAGQDKAWIFMVRSKIPGGRMSAEQWLLEEEIARKWSYGSLRITSRQGNQMHGVGKENLKNVIKATNDARLTTLGACGDVNRNVMTCPVCDLDWRAGLGLDDLAYRFADHFAPRTSAYWEIWCDGEKHGEKVAHSIVEPLYGKTYLPRKFKMAIAVPEDNCVDLYTNDLAIEAVHDRKRVLAYDVIVGGGMGFTHSKDETYPRIGTRIARAKPEEILEVAEEIVKVQRDFGGREKRDHARLKYLLDDRGVDWFKEELFRRLGRELPPAGPQPEYTVEDHLGWHEQRDGKLYIGIPIDAGRVQDTDASKLQTGLRAIISRFKPMVRNTAHQNIALVGINPSDRAEIDRMLDGHGIRTVDKMPKLHRRMMACPALPTCGLALADAERAMPDVLRELEALGSAGHVIELRMTGCPNSCVRTPTAEIGLSGRGPGKYKVHLGGSPEGTRLAYDFRETVTIEELAPLLHKLIQSWRAGAVNGESFGDWAWRMQAEGVEAKLQNAE